MLKGCVFLLSKRAVAILRVMEQAPDWIYLDDVKRLMPNFDQLSFNSLVSSGYICSASFEDDVPDFDEYGRVIHPLRYRISDKGLAHLESLVSAKWSVFRSWAALIIALLAMLVSAIALVKSW